MTRAFIGENLRRARQSLRLSQTTVAGYVGLSRQAVSAAESGKRAITVDELLKLADLYRIPVEAFLRPQPAPSTEDLSKVQRRANASGEKPLDQHDVYEFATFINVLRDDAKRGVNPRPAISAGTTSSPFRQIGTIADGVRTQFELTSPPINVYRVFSELGTRVRMTSLSTLSGAFIPWKRDRRAGVLINSSQPQDRQRFSAAHELGHCALGHAGADGEEIFSPLGRRFRAPEVEADRFASELLMPARLIQKEIDQLPKGGTLDASVYALADRFLVSYEAMVYRLGNLNAIPISQKSVLLQVRPTDIEARLRLKEKAKKEFDAHILKNICGKLVPVSSLNEIDGVRQLQEFAFEEYARTVPEVERRDTAAHVYEKVAVWVAETYPLLAA